MYVFDSHGTQLKVGDTVRSQSQTLLVITQIGTQASRGIWCAVKPPTRWSERPGWWEQSADLIYVEDDQ